MADNGNVHIYKGRDNAELSLYEPWSLGDDYEKAVYFRTVSKTLSYDVEDDDYYIILWHVDDTWITGAQVTIYRHGYDVWSDDLCYLCDYRAAPSSWVWTDDPSLYINPIDHIPYFKKECEISSISIVDKMHVIVAGVMPGLNKTITPREACMFNSVVMVSGLTRHGLFLPIVFLYFIILIVAYVMGKKYLVALETKMAAAAVPVVAMVTAPVAPPATSSGPTPPILQVVAPTPNQSVSDAVFMINSTSPPPAGDAPPAYVEVVDTNKSIEMSPVVNPSSSSSSAAPPAYEVVEQSSDNN